MNPSQREKDEELDKLRRFSVQQALCRCGHHLMRHQYAYAGDANNAYSCTACDCDNYHDATNLDYVQLRIQLEKKYGK